MSDDTGDIVNRCVDMLNGILEDNSVPKNIRRSADSIKDILLNSKESFNDRAASAISTLDEISSDPNIPMHTRTSIWELASQLETISIGR